MMIDLLASIHDTNTGFALSDEQQLEEEVKSDEDESAETPQSHSEAESKQSLDEVADVSPGEEKPKKRRSWKKPEGKPKRPLSAYNLFFQYEREKLIAKEKERHVETEFSQHYQSVKTNSTSSKRLHRKIPGMIGFAELARSISSKWKKIDPKIKMHFESEAEREKFRYKIALARWRGDAVSEPEEISPMIRIASEHTSPQHPTAAGGELKHAQRHAGFLPATMRLGVRPNQPALQVQDHSKEFVFFPRLLPNADFLEASNQIPPLNRATRHVELNQPSIRRPVAASRHMTQGLRRPPCMFPHDLVLYSDILGRRSTVVGLPLLPQDYRTLQVLEQRTLPPSVVVNVAQADWPFFIF